MSFAMDYCFSLMMLFCLAASTMVGATQFKVGGQSGWSVPAPNAEPYNQWAERNRFQIGDSILFVYPANTDSVLQVDKDAYNSCNTTTYIEKFDDGNTVFTFNRSGPFYFISGSQANCLKKESLAIAVLADRSNRAAGASQPSLPPSPVPASSSSPPPTPAPEASSSPSSSTPPTPSPEGSSSSSPPPPTSSTTTPSPSSSAEGTPSSAPGGGGETSPPPPPPSPSGASAIVVGLVGAVGTLFGSVLLAL